MFSNSERGNSELRTISTHKPIINDHVITTVCRLPGRSVLGVCNWCLFGSTRELRTGSHRSHRCQACGKPRICTGRSWKHIDHFHSAGQTDIPRPSSRARWAHKDHFRSAFCQHTWRTCMNRAHLECRLLASNAHLSGRSLHCNFSIDYRPREVSWWVCHWLRLVFDNGAPICTLQQRWTPPTDPPLSNYK